MGVYRKMGLERGWGEFPDGHTLEGLWEALQAGSSGDEAQIVQSGTWDGDSTIPAVASPVASPG